MTDQPEEPEGGTVGTNAGNTLIGILLSQHESIRQQFALVRSADGEQKKQLFDELCTYLIAHETGEQTVLRPLTKNTVGVEVAEARNHEEAVASATIEQLKAMDAGSEEFETALEELENAVVAHAEHEEQEEFPHITAAYSEEELLDQGARLRSVEESTP